jgi:hypothetical protein
VALRGTAAKSRRLKTEKDKNMRKLLTAAAAAAIGFAPFTVFAAPVASADQCDRILAVGGPVAGPSNPNWASYQRCESSLGQQPSDACAGITPPDSYAVCESVLHGGRLQP